MIAVVLVPSALASSLVPVLVVLSLLGVAVLLTDRIARPFGLAAVALLWWIWPSVIANDPCNYGGWFCWF